MQRYLAWANGGLLIVEQLRIAKKKRQKAAVELEQHGSKVIIVVVKIRKTVYV